MPARSYADSTALLSDCGRYRYRLARQRFGDPRVCVRARRAIDSTCNMDDNSRLNQSSWTEGLWPSVD
jgi:hypothetical protein